MNIKEHGTWSTYEPKVEERPEGAPFNAMFACRDGDGKDWYEYVNDEKTFAKDSIKMIVHAGVVGAVVTDATMLWPGNNATVLEVFDKFTDPRKEFGNKVYNPAAKTFSDPPPPPQAASGMAELIKRIEALEGKG